MRAQESLFPKHYFSFMGFVVCVKERVSDDGVRQSVRRIDAISWVVPHQRVKHRGCDSGAFMSIVDRDVSDEYAVRIYRTENRSNRMVADDCPDKKSLAASRGSRGSKSIWISDRLIVSQAWRRQP
jgi:hypothetical protein